MAQRTTRNGLWGTPAPGVLFVTIVGAGALVAALARAASVILQARAGGNAFQDDAFYYLVIARNVVLHGSLSFDGVHVTNGFHPLWMALMVLVQRLLGPGATPAAQVVAVTNVEQCLYVVATALAAIQAVRWARRASPYAAAFLALALFLASPLAWVFRQGMETTLAALLLVVVLQLLVAQRYRSLGIALALLVLARLDTAVFIALPLLIAACVQQRDWRARVVTLAPVLLVVLATTCANLLLTSHAVPVSGTLKSSFPWPRWQPGFFVEAFNLAHQYGAQLLFTSYNLPLVTALLVLGLAAMLLRPAARPVPGTLWAVWVSGALLVLNLALFQRWNKSIDPRYFALPMMMALFAGAAALAVALRFHGDALRARVDTAVPQSRQAWPRGPGAIAAAFAFAIALVLVMHAAWLDVAATPGRDALTALMQDADKALPPDAVVAGTDVGALAFWTRRRVVNLDGVVNDFAYQDALRDKHLGAWLAAEGVTHIATGLVDREPAYTGRPFEPMYRQGVDARAVPGGDYGAHRFYVYSYRYGNYSDAIDLAAADEVFRRDLGADAFNHTVYVIYAWHPPVAAH